ncbi:MAG: SAM-dependent methyltransferase, partial [Sphingobacteriales bacterium]
MSQHLPAHPSSYRDPSGFIFRHNGVVYRQVNRRFKADFDRFITSGCYKALVDANLLIPHEEIDENLTGSNDYYKTLRPEQVPFISYPYEWSFDMLRDAALLTLQVLKLAMDHGMMLKDATPYNIQWYKGRLIFIDTLSFVAYEERPWIAYRQFCEQFLAPLLLMHYSKTSLQPLSLAWMEGIPLQEASKLLPFKSRFSLHTFLHIHLHAKVSRSKTGHATRPAVFKRQKMNNLITSLSLLINKL